MNNQDQVVAQQQIYMTTDYEKFRLMKGNRVVDKAHVKSIAKKMQQEGNLMGDFPIQVNGDMEIIDGQHRILAAQLNKMPVYYTIVANANLDTVISLNTENRNWTWLNYAQSWAERGDTDYIAFMDLYNKYRCSFQVLLRYCQGDIVQGLSTTPIDKTWRGFRQGDFHIKDLELTQRLLEQYSELAEEAGTRVREFAFAAYSYMRTPEYNHVVMIDKIRRFGDGLRRCYTVADFLIELENISRA